MIYIYIYINYRADLPITSASPEPLSPPLQGTQDSPRWPPSHRHRSLWRRNGSRGSSRRCAALVRWANHGGCLSKKDLRRENCVDGLRTGNFIHIENDRNISEKKKLRILWWFTGKESCINGIVLAYSWYINYRIKQAYLKDTLVDCFT